MADIPRDMESGEGFVEPEGYQQELKRTLGSFQMFAISFAFISVAVGIFGTYDVVLQRGGPVGIWLWVLVAVGQLLVALVYAQFAARISLSGSSYQWASRLASPKIGLGFGWLTTCYLAIGVVAVDNALAETAFMPLFGIQPDEHIARLITVVVLLIQVVLVVVSARLASMINSSAVGNRTGARRRAVDRADRRCGCHGPRFTGEPGVSGCHGEIFRLFHRRWRADGRDDHGPRHPRRLRLRGEPCRGGQGPLPQRPTRNRGIGGSGRGAGTGVRDHGHHRDRLYPEGHRQRFTNRGDNSRSARFSDGKGIPDRDYAGVLWRRDSGHDGMLTARFRDVARLALPCPPTDATGQSAYAYADTGDAHDLRRGGRPDGRAAGRCAAEADRRVDDPPGDHLQPRQSSSTWWYANNSVARRARSTWDGSNCRSLSARWCGWCAPCLCSQCPGMHSSPT